jgi:hypothetical protein
MDRLNKDIIREISSYLVQPKYKMVDWIKPYFEYIKNSGNKEFWLILSMNKYSHDFILENYPDKIKWDFILSNPCATDFIIENIHKFDKNKLGENHDFRLLKYYENNNKNYFGNPFCINKIDKLIYEKSGLFGKNTEYKLDSKIDLLLFLSNRNAYIIFEKYENEINWYNFSKKYDESSFFQYEASYPFFIRHHQKINSAHIYRNPLFINYAKENISKIDIKSMFGNEKIIEFIFSKEDDNMYRLKYNIEIFDSFSLISNNSFIKFMINNNFYYDNKKYNGKEYLINMVNKYDYWYSFAYNKESIPIIKDTYVDININTYEDIDSDIGTNEDTYIDVETYLTNIENKDEYTNIDTKQCVKKFISIFFNEGIFEIDIPKSIERYDRFITKH